MMRCVVLLASGALLAVVLGGCPFGQDVASARQDRVGEGPRLGDDRITQSQIQSGDLSLLELRRRGRDVFSMPFSKLDGYGDGPMDPTDPTTPGGRPTLQGNGTFLRVNGLDGQSCLECHSILSTASIPMTFGVGGVGGSVTNAIFQPTLIDLTDDASAGMATFNGRFINPPFLFGSGGVELLGKEMTAELQALEQQARENPGRVVRLITKGVDFGAIRYVDGEFDTTGVEGIDADLIVRPFGRKGEFPTVRQFDIGALQFHFGMQAVELVGEDVDTDGDGVMNEVLVGEVSALHIFNTTLERPVFEPQGDAEAGARLFEDVGCAACHIPALVTTSRNLTYSFPEVADDSTANVFYEVDLTADPTAFQPDAGGGIVVPLFADLKRHDMGSELEETFGSDLDAAFTTARLWGVADSAPYLHDGRAMTLTEAILMHGGEARTARDAFADLSKADRQAVIDFLRSLRTPLRVGRDLDR